MDLWSCEYEVNGELFSMQICGTYEEALVHAESINALRLIGEAIGGSINVTYYGL